MHCGITDVSLSLSLTHVVHVTGLPTVEFSREDYSVTENEGFVEIMLTISPPPSDTQFLRSVFFSTADGSATGETTPHSVPPA